MTNFPTGCKDKYGHAHIIFLQEKHPFETGFFPGNFSFE